jgi:hypothetical protein
MLSAILSLAAPAVFSSVPALAAMGLPSFAASAIGGGLGSLLEGGNQKDALQAAALGGLGSYLGGKLGGGAAGGSNIAGGTMPGFGTGAGIPGGGASTAEAIKGGIPMASGDVYGKIADTGFTAALTRPEAIGAGLGASLAMPSYKPKKEEEKEYPRGMPIKNTSIFPEYGYDAGKEGEFNYRIPKNYAEGGELEMEMSPMDMGLGGMAEEGMNDKELISGAIDVIQGEISDPDEQNLIISKFVTEFGQEALQDLVQRVRSGEIPDVPKEGDGMVKGAGDGMADMIPASMEGDQDVLLSDGEFVVPADVVSGIGNGSSDAGANKLEDMMDRVRELRTGGKTQPPAIPDEMMLPA